MIVNNNQRPTPTKMRPAPKRQSVIKSDHVLNDKEKQQRRQQMKNEVTVSLKVENLDEIERLTNQVKEDFERLKNSVQALNEVRAEVKVEQIKEKENDCV